MKKMTEAQVRCAGPQEYMNPAMVAFFKDRLETILAAICASNSNPMRDEELTATDPVDKAALEEERRLSILEQRRNHERANKVQQALRRIESGDYGFCESSGDEIGIERLLAVPTAAYSVEAQGAIEYRARFADRSLAAA